MKYSKPKKLGLIHGAVDNGTKFDVRVSTKCNCPFPAFAG